MMPRGARKARGAGTADRDSLSAVPARKGLVANLHSQIRCLPLVRAQGIEVESPQEAHRRFRGLGTDSPVFLPGLAGKKMRPKIA
jgi:hypothetical protein